MSDDNPLPWTDRHWDELRSVALEASRKSRVASTFLPLVGPLPTDQTTVAANWMRIRVQDGIRQLEVRSGKTLQLVTLACNLYLRGSEISDSELDAAKSLVRRAGELLGRLEDAIVFHGLTPEVEDPLGDLKIQPEIYTITGGRDLTGLLQCPDTVFVDEAGEDDAPPELTNIQKAGSVYVSVKPVGGQDLADAGFVYQAFEKTGQDLLMSVGLGRRPSGEALVRGVVDAIQRLEARGHFGPFAVVLGHNLFSVATTPSGSLVLPTDRIAEFLDGRRVLRSGVLPKEKGVVVALGGQPIELVLANDIDVRFLQATVEPRYVLRVFERMVLRIKELDAVCTLTSEDSRLEPGFVSRKARS